MGNEHAKLGAPVANVVDAEDLMAEELERARKTVANNGRAQVADVHLCGVDYESERC